MEELGLQALRQQQHLNYPQRNSRLAKGSAFKPDTSVSDYDYLGYIHSSNNHKSPVVPEKKEGTVLVHFVDENGNTIAQDETLSGKIGEQYKSEAKTFTGYILKEVPENATGTFTDQPQEVTYVYTKELVQGADVIVHYVDEEGVALAQDEKLTGNVGEQYTSEAKTITGYILKEVPGNQPAHLLSSHKKSLMCMKKKNS